MSGWAVGPAVVGSNGFRLRVSADAARAVCTTAAVLEREREDPRVSSERVCCVEAMRQSGSTNPGASAWGAADGAAAQCVAGQGSVWSEWMVVCPVSECGALHCAALLCKASPRAGGDGHGPCALARVPQAA
jgi:hypothetical protein